MIVRCHASKRKEKTCDLKYLVYTTFRQDIDFFLKILYFQQSSTDIWLAICTAVKRALSLADVAGEDVTGIGFAATCSLGQFTLILSDVTGQTGQKISLKESWSNGLKKSKVTQVVFYYF